MVSAAGARVLVVEDEPTVALALHYLLSDLGYEAVGPVGDAEKAAAFATAVQIDAAILDVNLMNGDVAPTADKLESRGIPFVFVTASAGSIPRRHRNAPVLSKPYDDQELADVLETVVASETATF